MKTILIFIVLIFATTTFAQDIPQGPADAGITTQQPTPEAPEAKPESAAEETNAVQNIKAKFLMDAGIQYADEGEYEDAEQAYLRALENNPGDPNTRFRLSTLYIMMERYREAVALLTALIEEFPDNPQTYNNLAWVYATGGEMKNGKMALRHARDAILIEPNSPSLWNTLAEAYYVFGQYDKALRASDMAIDLLKQQNASEEQIREFESQRDKINRADEALKRLFGTDDEEE